METHFYENLKKINLKDLKKSKKIVLSIQLARVFFFVVTLSSFILFLSSESKLFLLLSVVCFSLFAILIFLNRSNENRYQYLKNLEAVVDREFNINNKDFHRLKPVNFEIDQNHPYAFDLDVIGNNSLFLRLNRTNSALAEKKLIKSLTELDFTSKEIIERQDGIKELASKHSLNVEFMAISFQYYDEEFEIDKIQETLQATPIKVNIIYVFLALVLSICTVCFLILAIYQILPHYFWMGLFIFNLIFTNLIKHYKADNILGKDKSFLIIQKYRDLSQHLSNFNFQDKYLKTFSVDNLNTYKFLSKLASVLNIQKSSNFITNGFFLLDIYIFKMIEILKLKKSINFKNNIIKLGHLEELISLTFFHFNNPSYIFPKVSEKSHILNFEKIGHPFLNINECVTNDFKEDGQNIILTGSNMSGKSTFLRSVGLNFVLAMIGAPVFASQFEASRGKLFTSIKTVDSLKEQKSFFYSEILRLTQIQDNINNSLWSLVLLDETLKGTNSEDKLTGSLLLAKRFGSLNCTLFFATHDTQMGVLESSEKNSFLNYCFESTIIEDELEYDFKLKKGITRSKNATFLLRKLGVID